MTEKPKIIYTRVRNQNNKYIDRITHKAGFSRATCIDDILSFLRESVSEQTIIQEIAKRRNKVRETGKPISGLSS